jgi:ERCC4-related helicase
MFIQEFDNGNVYVSAKHGHKIFELLENDDDEAIQRLIDEGKAIKYHSNDFTPNFRQELQEDIDTLKKIKESWKQIERDPKLIKFKEELKQDTGLKKNHLIIFTESKETAEYLYKNLSLDYPDKVLCYTGGSNETFVIK